MYLLSSSTSFHSPEGPDDISSFTTGNVVGIMVQNKNEANSVWLIGENVEQRDHKNQVDPTNSRPRPLLQIDGVWTN